MGRKQQPSDPTVKLNLGDRVSIKVWQDGWLAREYIGVVTTKKILEPDYTYKTITIIKFDYPDDSYITIQPATIQWQMSVGTK